MNLELESARDLLYTMDTDSPNPLKYCSRVESGSSIVNYSSTVSIHLNDEYDPKYTEKIRESVVSLFVDGENLDHVFKELVASTEEDSAEWKSLKYLYINCYESQLIRQRGLINNFPCLRCIIVTGCAMVVENAIILSDIVSDFIKFICYDPHTIRNMWININNKLSSTIIETNKMDSSEDGIEKKEMSRCECFGNEQALIERVVRYLESIRERNMIVTFSTGIGENSFMNISTEIIIE